MAPMLKIDDTTNQLRPPVARMVKFRTLWLPQCLSAAEMQSIADAPDSWLLELYADIFQYGPHVHKTLANLTRIQELLLGAKSTKFMNALRFLTQQNENLIERVYLNWYDLVKERTAYDHKAFSNEPISVATAELLAKKYEHQVQHPVVFNTGRLRFVSKRTAEADINHIVTIMLCSDIVLNNDKADNLTERYKKFCKKWGLTP